MSAGAWMLFVATATLSGDPNTPRDPVDAATIRWAERAEGYAAGIDVSNDSSQVWLGIVAAYINAGEPDRANEAKTRVRGPSDWGDRILGISLSQAATWGDDARAVQFAQGIQARDTRNGALYWIAIFQIQRGSIARAEKTVRLIEGPHGRSLGWAQIAQALASRGQYDAALEAADQIDAQDAEAKQAAFDTIGFCRSQDREFGKRTCARPLRGAGYGPELYDTWRASLLMEHPLVIYPGDFRKTEAGADEMGSLEDRASAWLQLAWEYHDRRQPKARDRAIARSRDLLESASDPNKKADGYCLLADLCVELGQKKRAREFVVELGKAARAGRRRPWGNGCDPLWIGVLVRLGDVDAAVEVAKSPQGRAAIGSWQALGEVLAYEGRAGEIEKRLAAAPDDSARGLLCVGAAAGLQRRKASEKLREASREK